MNRGSAVLLMAFMLVLGLLLGTLSGITDRIFGSDDPRAIATESLKSMRAENRLTVFAARYVSVVTSENQKFDGLLSARRTLILPGDVRYELDLSKLRPEDVVWDGRGKILHVLLPEIDVAGPDVDIQAVREYGGGGVLSALTDINRQLDQANRDRAVTDLRKQATAAIPIHLARQTAREAIQRSFALPLAASGFKDVKVEARFPTDGYDHASYIDLSTPYERQFTKRSACALKGTNDRSDHQSQRSRPRGRDRSSQT